MLENELQKKNSFFVTDIEENSREELENKANEATTLAEAHKADLDAKNVELQNLRAEFNILLQERDDYNTVCETLTKEKNHLAQAEFLTRQQNLELEDHG